MIVNGHVSCGYCSAVIAELEPWPAGERREFVCLECGCVNGLHVSVRGKQVSPSETKGAPSFRAGVAKAQVSGTHGVECRSISTIGTHECHQGRRRSSSGFPWPAPRSLERSLL